MLGKLKEKIEKNMIHLMTIILNFFSHLNELSYGKLSSGTRNLILWNRTSSFPGKGSLRHVYTYQTQGQKIDEEKK